MSTRLVASLMALATVGAASVLAPADAAGQAPQGTKAAATWVPPRTQDGQPDIRGYWSQRNNITTYSLQEGVADRAEHIRMSGQAPALGHAIKDPADEKIPYQPWAAKKAALHKDEHRHPSKPEYLDPVSRGFLEGVPRINLQGGFQIIQRPGHVVILYDYGHTYRVFPDGRPHLGQNVKLWMGDSRGHWEGNTLVVDVTNNNDQTWFDIVGSFHSDALHMVERWTYVAADRIDYEVTIEDPKVYTRPWKMAWNYGRNPPEEQWEQAVWEGNHAAGVILAASEPEK